MNKGKRKPKKKISKADELLAGSMEVEVSPDGRLVPVGKGKDRGMKGLPIPAKTFY